MDYDVNRFAEECMREINEKLRNLKRLNIVVAGKTGVGKSTLINTVFREQLAKTGVGKPVTQKLRELSKPDFPLHIYDTKGLELGNDVQKNVTKEIFELIEKGVHSKNTNEQIHCIWYCINAASDRIEDAEIDWLRVFTEENKQTQVPVILVLTKAFSKKSAQEFESYIENLNLPISQIVPVLAQDYEIDSEYVVKAYGADRLIQVMGSVLVDELIPTLQNVQKASIKQKVVFSQKIVATTVAASFGEGFAPIPFSDAALLVPTQVGMIAGITAAFGMDVNKGFLSTIVSSVLGSAGATIAGKTIVANLFKLIPGAGTAVGGAISGGTAALLTTAMGGAYIKIMELIAKGELDEDSLTGEKGREEIVKLFKEELKSSRKS